MNSVERVHLVLRGQIPDAVPCALYDVAIDCYNESTLKLFQQKCKKHPCDCFRQDLRGIALRWDEETKARHERQGSAIREIQSASQAKEIMTLWRPEPPEMDELRLKINTLHAAGYPAVVVGTVSDFETPFALRGREQFYCDLGYQEDWLPVFLDEVTAAAEDQARAAAMAGADIFGIGDDLGSQRGLLIAPDTWRTLFKIRLKRIVDAVKNTNPETAFFLHTDGQVGEIIPDFIEIGVDILNPIQPEVMDPAEVKRLYGSELIFFGAISVQNTLPFGSPEQVAGEVKLRMETIGAEGGYLMTPSHLLNADIPWENIVAFFEAAERYGNYKLFKRLFPRKLSRSRSLLNVGYGAAKNHVI